VNKQLSRLYAIRLSVLALLIAGGILHPAFAKPQASKNFEQFIFVEWESVSGVSKAMLIIDSLEDVGSKAKGTIRIQHFFSGFKTREFDANVELLYHNEKGYFLLWCKGRPSAKETGVNSHPYSFDLYSADGLNFTSGIAYQSHLNEETGSKLKIIKHSSLRETLDLIKKFYTDKDALYGTLIMHALYEDELRKSAKE
jgi:hypothetical protein